MSNRLTQVD